MGRSSPPAKLEAHPRKYINKLPSTKTSFLPRLHNHIEGGEATQVERPVGHLGDLDHLGDDLAPQGLGGGDEGGAGGVVH